MEKINIAELLKDCPQGMELDCTMYEDCKFLDVETEGNRYLIRITTPCGIKYLDKYGCYTTSDKAKCVIFPKGKTTWDGFVPPYVFKDGDIVAAETDSGLQVFILQKAKSDYQGYCYIGYDFEFNEVFDAGEWVFDRLATEKEKAELFDTIKANGYKWNAETKTLEKLIEPNFKVGDIIQDEDGYKVKITKVDIDEEYYEYLSMIAKGIGAIHFEDQNNWELELGPDKFDITTLKPFDKVLVKSGSLNKWHIQLFEKYDKACKYPFICMGYNKYKECIPYEGNEHLLDTTVDCDNFYKTWEQ